MSNTCDSLISIGVSPNCDDPIVKGLEPNGVIINRQDLDFGSVTFNETRKNVVETLALKTGKKGYPVFIPGNTPFTGTNTTLETGNFGNTFANNVGMVILDNGPDVCSKLIDGIANGEFVVILENKYKNLNKDSAPGDSAFQIYGFYSGLKASTLENDKYSEDTNGGWNVVLAETGSPRSALFLFKTDYTTTKAAFDSLTEEPSL